MESSGNFTPLAQQALMLARKEADRLHHNFVGTEHLLLGLIRLGQGVAVNVLHKMGLDLQAVRVEIEKKVGTTPDQTVLGAIPYTPRVKKALALAAEEARALHHVYLGTEHMLLGLLREPDGVASHVLHDFGVDTDKTRREILKELDPNYQPPSAETCTAVMPQAPASSKSAPDLVDPTKRYDVYCAERDQVMVYQNALFKGAKRLFPNDQLGITADFIELEQADSQTVFVARSSIVKFCEHGGGPGSDKGAGQTL
jgi:ATP-dependent Clp protease ATP-binding subunit ClpA